MEYFVCIYECENKKFRVFLNTTNSTVTKKFNEISRKPRLVEKFTLVIEAVRLEVHNRSQFNWEAKCDYGNIYAIKVDNHRFYTVVVHQEGYRDLYICRYGRKQTNQNDKKLTATIESIAKIDIQKFFSDE